LVPATERTVTITCLPASARIAAARDPVNPAERHVPRLTAAVLAPRARESLQVVLPAFTLTLRGMRFADSLAVLDSFTTIRVTPAVVCIDVAAFSEAWALAGTASARHRRHQYRESIAPEHARGHARTRGAAAQQPLADRGRTSG
jgi:hypothetical protein